MDVPFLSDLNKTRVVLQETTATEAASAKADPDSSCRSSIRQAWKEYLIHVLPHARTQIKNFMLACLAEGRCHASEEEAGHRRGTSLYCQLSLQDIRRAMDFQAKAASKLASEDVTSDGVAAAAESSFSQTNKRILATAQVAMKLAQETASVCSTSTGVASHCLRQHCRTSERPPDAPKGDEESGQLGCTVQSSQHDWKAAYVAWHDKTHDPKEPVRPNELQNRVLKAIHQRCVLEAEDLHKISVDISSVPLLRLIHGLPGSGKSELLRWIRSYFEEVWMWGYGDEFCFLAPLNTMACQIGGDTVHSWGRIRFMDRRGMIIAPKESDNRETPAMTMKVLNFYYGPCPCRLPPEKRIYKCEEGQL